MQQKFSSPTWKKVDDPYAASRHNKRLRATLIPIASIVAVGGGSWSYYARDPRVAFAVGLCLAGLWCTYQRSKYKKRHLPREESRT